MAALPLRADDIGFSPAITQAEFQKFSRIIAQGIFPAPIQPAGASGLTRFDIGIAATAVQVDPNAAYWVHAVNKDILIASKYIAVPRLVVTKGLGAASVSGSYAKLGKSSGSIVGGSLAAEESIFLLPIGLVHVNGAYGSVWESELTIKNAGQEVAGIGSAADQCQIECPFASLGVEPSQALVLIDRFQSSALARPEGILLRVRSSVQPADVRFNFRIRDLSRQESTWGTELPVVRASAFTPSPLHLLNLPTDARFRFTVRVYAIEGEGPIPGRARFYELRSGALLREIPFMLQRFGTATYYPAYAQLDSLSPALANLGIDPIGVEIVADATAQKLWAFATVTNNDSQHVTTITPQPAP